MGDEAPTDEALTPTTDSKSFFGGLKAKKSLDWLGRSSKQARRVSVPAAKVQAGNSTSLLQISVARIFPSSPKSSHELSSAESTYFERTTGSTSGTSSGPEDLLSDEERAKEEAERKQKDAALLKSWLSKDALRRMLDEPRCLWKFGRFLSKEMSAEVLVFWLNAEQHRQDLERIHSFSKRVHALHVPDNASLALNISFKERAELNNSVQNFLRVDDPFAAAREMALEALFRDPWPRFLSHRLALAHERGLHQMAVGVLPLSAKLAKCFVLSSPDGSQPIQLVSKEFTTVTGYQAVDIIGRNCRFLQGPGTSHEAIDRIRQALREGRQSHELLLNYTVTGNPFFNLLLTVPLFDGRGSIVAYLGYQVDVTGLMSRAPNLARLLADELDSDDEDAAPSAVPGSNYKRMQQEQVDATIKAKIQAQQPIDLHTASGSYSVSSATRRKSKPKIVHGPSSQSTILSRDQRLHEASALAFDATAARQGANRSSSRPPTRMSSTAVSTPNEAGGSPTTPSGSIPPFGGFGLGLAGSRVRPGSRPTSRGNQSEAADTLSNGHASSICSSPRVETAATGVVLEDNVAEQAANVFVILERDGLSVLYADPRLAPDIKPGMRTTAAFKASGDLAQRLAHCARTGDSFAVECPVRLGGLLAAPTPGSPALDLGDTHKIVVAGTALRNARDQCGAVVVMLHIGANARTVPLPVRM